MGCFRGGRRCRRSSSPTPPAPSWPHGCCAPTRCRSSTRSYRSWRHHMPLDDRAFADLVDVRVREPARIASAHTARRRRTSVTRDGMLFIVDADHTARGMVGLGDVRRAMADRRSMLDRLLVALEHPRVDGVLGSADILDDLAVLGALEEKFVAGTMNRGGLAGARWELDDLFTAYDVDHIVASNLDAGK